MIETEILHVESSDVKVSEEDFVKYEIVRESGIVNMWDTLCVSEISELDFNIVRRIRREYEHLNKKYGVLNVGRSYERS